MPAEIYPYGPNIDCPKDGSGHSCRAIMSGGGGDGDVLGFRKRHATLIKKEASALRRHLRGAQ